MGSTGNKGNLDEKSFIGIKLYTQNDIYGNLNRFLYDTYAKKPEKDMSAYQKWFPIVGWISKSLEKLPDYEGYIYRGMRNTKLENYLGLLPGV